MEDIEVALLGATGKTGSELKPILENHPHTSVQAPRTEELEEFEGSEVVFSALPNGESAKWVARFRERGCTVIDSSGDLRFPTVNDYERWYGRKHPAPWLVSENIPYGLVELNREQLEPGRKLVSMPGCYPTAVALMVAPLVKRDFVEDNTTTTVVAVSGYSGAGKQANNSDVLDEEGRGYNVRQYKTGREHQHVGEMEKWLGGNTVLFAPAKLSIERGILAHATVQLRDGVSSADIVEAFEEDYAPEPFVLVHPEGTDLSIAETAHTDECHISFVVLKNTVLVSGVIDNLRKGSASPAVQAFNLIRGLPEETGLTPKAGWQHV